MASEEKSSLITSDKIYYVKSLPWVLSSRSLDHRLPANLILAFSSRAALSSTQKTGPLGIDGAWR